MGSPWGALGQNMQMRCKQHANPPCSGRGRPAKWSWGALLPQGGVNRRVSPGDTKLPYGGDAPLVGPHHSAFTRWGLFVGNKCFLNTYCVPGPTLPPMHRVGTKVAPATMCWVPGMRPWLYMVTHQSRVLWIAAIFIPSFLRLREVK